MTFKTAGSIKNINEMIKRGGEFIVAIFILSGVLPLFIFIAILIKLESKGPVLFTQMRGGKNNRHFLIYKFRTMLDDDSLRNDNVHVSNTDSRITKVGYYLRKTSLDELPQLFNIIKGEMSFVGPRPTLTSQTDGYNSYQMQRLLVNPGVTGWAQVKGRNSLSWNEKIELDLDYIKRRSIYFDIYILFQTVQKVIKFEDVFAKAKNFDEEKKNIP